MNESYDMWGEPRFRYSNWSEPKGPRKGFRQPKSGKHRKQHRK